MAKAGPAAAFALDAVTFAVSAVTLALLRPVTVRPQEHDTAPNLRTVFAATPALPIMLIVVLVGNLASGGVFAVALPILAYQRFSTPSYGLVLAALTAGALVGTTFGAEIRTRWPSSLSPGPYRGGCPLRPLAAGILEFRRGTGLRPPVNVAELAGAPGRARARRCSRGEPVSCQPGRRDVQRL